MSLLAIDEFCFHFPLSNKTNPFIVFNMEERVSTKLRRRRRRRWQACPNDENGLILVGTSLATMLCI